MGKGLFITGTGTDVGKTYVTALIIKALRHIGCHAGYYKAAISGATNVPDSDAGYVNAIAAINESEDMLLSYLYQSAVSPHLAARWEGNPLEKEVILTAYAAAAQTYDYVTMEGSGGIICPLRHDKTAVYYLCDIIQWLHLPSLIVANAGLGTINATVLTVDYMKHHKLPVRGIILNHYTGSAMEQDNIAMIEEITGLPILAVVRTGDQILSMDAAKLAALYG